MKKLEEKIRKEGRILPGDILKIDNFLNHQIDTAFVDELGEEFARLYRDTNPTKILTVEASGIVVAYTTAVHLGNLPIVFAKKGSVALLDDNVYSAPVHSYTRGTDICIRVDKHFLSKEDRVLLIDDFLANGEAFGGLIELCRQAGCEVVGCGTVVEKAYQPGGDKIRNLGYRVEALARVAKMTDDGQIEFCD